MGDTETCANPGCNEPGIHKCSACKTTHYCGPICQTADWSHHKVECPGHLRKVGMAHLEKARTFNQGNNWLQTLRYADLALTKLKQLKDRSLASIEVLDDALGNKFDALNFMNRNKEVRLYIMIFPDYMTYGPLFPHFPSFYLHIHPHPLLLFSHALSSLFQALDCATERYNMWAMTNIRNPRTIESSFPLIDSLIENKEFVQAQLIASTVYDMAMHPTNHDIPEYLQQPLLALASHYLTSATCNLAQSGGIPPEEKQKVGKGTIVLARKALEMHTQLHGAESEHALNSQGLLARVLTCFNDNDNDDDEAIRLYEQVIAIRIRLEGSSTVNVAANTRNLGNVYVKRANRAMAANDLDRCLPNWVLAAPCYSEAVRIYRAINLVDDANHVQRMVTHAEERIRDIRIEIIARATATLPPAAANRG